MTNLTNYYQIGKKIAHRYPELAREIMEEEVDLKDWRNDLPGIYEKFKSLHEYPKSKKQQTIQRMEFVAVIVMHLDRDALYCNKALKRGIRSLLARILQCDDTLISNTLKTVKNYLSIYKDFQASVEYLYSELFENSYDQSKC